MGDETEAGPAASEETELLPPTTSTEQPAAWSAAEAPDEEGRSAWPRVWLWAAAILIPLAVVAAAIALPRWHSQQHAATAKSAPSATLTQSAPISSMSPATTAGPTATRADDDEFVAIAISPKGIVSGSHRGGFGTSGTQERANAIAMGQCRAITQNDDCMLANGGMFHGCVAYAVNDSLHAWSSGSGVDPDAARAAALHRLHGVATAVYVQCSDPPGLVGN
ncbi:hypothetical protein A5791_10325 [Mycobacterium sp. 852002-51163_SCH5372311]|uniref:DUF4189 domain-containing protein n=1 Tax=Mycobacterium sp. 852002-51163_SCH5372311 TaxID=1834097 RepID=UPI0008023A4F|nr:hypothetical protein [Mycobacterium sp. 852002-51163_SCH5372311]OBF79871.1 hypothetical protein A5791_10325 [Mycobacterium sp. 852002-51163_SCH5372311]